MACVLAVSLASLGVVSGATARIGGSSVSVTAATVRPNDLVVARVVGAPPRQWLRIYLRVATTDAPLIPVGRVQSNGRGTARLTFHLPALQGNVYRPWLRLAGKLVVGHGLLSVVASPPPGFGSLGTSGCAPSSPRNQTGTGIAATEVFGTSAGAELWALGASQPTGDQASLSGVLDKQTKIVFRMTSGVPTLLYAVAPDGTKKPPAWGPDPHIGSNWQRPGAEWGAAFVFDQVGCWRIHAGAPPTAGDLWLSVTS